MKQQAFFAPHPLLRNYIRYFWTFDHNTSPSDVIYLRIMADRFPKLILQDSEGKSGIMKPNHECLPQNFVSGIISKPLSFKIKGDYSHFGVSFTPDAIRHIFGVKPNTLMDSFKDLSLLVPQNLSRELGTVECTKKKMSLLTHFFWERIKNTSRSNHVAVLNLLWNTKKYQHVPVGDIAKSHGLSERSLERQFKELVGISPKKYLQLYRFEQTYKSLTVNAFDSLSEVGYQNGFSDQSHFIRNFKQYSGILPTTYMEEVKRENEGRGVLFWNYTKPKLKPFVAH